MTQRNSVWNWLITFSLPHQVDGRALTSWLHGEPAATAGWRHNVFWEFDFRSDAETLGLNPYEGECSVPHLLINSSINQNDL